jgi:hypothetical protein
MYKRPSLPIIELEAKEMAESARLVNKTAIRKIVLLFFIEIPRKQCPVSWPNRIEMFVSRQSLHSFRANA